MNHWFSLRRVYGRAACPCRRSRLDRRRPRRPRRRPRRRYYAGVCGEWRVARWRIPARRRGNVEGSLLGLGGSLLGLGGSLLGISACKVSSGLFDSLDASVGGLVAAERAQGHNGARGGGGCCCVGGARSCAFRSIFRRRTPHVVHAARTYRFYLIATACATAHTVAGGVVNVESTYNMTARESAPATLRIADECAMPPDMRAMPACQLR